MPCFHPVTAFQSLEGGPIQWREGSNTRQLLLPCRQCIGCRLRDSANWATRCMHEAKMHRFNTWVTLTYDDEHLPSKYFTGQHHPFTGKPIYSGTLYKLHTQRFIRATRKALGRKKSKIQFDSHPVEKPNGQVRIQKVLRYYYGGEYGDRYGRPHYHLCLFGIQFGDLDYEKKTETGYKLYTSNELKKLWPHGQHLIGELTWESAAYTARYIMKKINGQRKTTHYEKLDQETGEIIQLEPEYNDMSRKPGIAQPWLNKYMNDVYPHDQVIIRGKKARPPRYYDKQYEKKYPDEMELLKFGRELEAKLNWEKQTDERLKAEEAITERRIQSIKQKF